MKQKSNTDKFVIKARAIHGDKYDYSTFTYTTAKIKSRIICKIHGEFSQTPNRHLLAGGCPTCGNLNKGRKRLDTNILIEKFKEVHGDKYDYSDTEYLGHNIKVKIYCHKHGHFKQGHNHHLNGHGCPKCAIYEQTKNQRSNLSEFINKANLIHKNEYDYSNSIYKTNKHKLCIICTEHGEFWQSPNTHLRNHGCPKCKSSHGEKEISKVLKSKGVNFIEQHRFSDCRNKLPLPFDFYLQDHNVCIEYDHKQHYEPIGFFGGVDGLKERQRLDKIKTEYCEAQGIRLIRIRYDEDINERLINLL